MDDLDAHLVSLFVGIDHLQAVDVGGGDIFGALVVDALHDFTRHGFGHGGVGHGEAAVGSAAAVEVGVGEQVEAAGVAQQNLRRIVLRVEVPRGAGLEVEHTVGEGVVQALDMLHVDDIVAHLIDVLCEGAQLWRGKGVL